MSGTLSTYFELSYTPSTNSGREILGKPSFNFQISENSAMNTVQKYLEANTSEGTNYRSYLEIFDIKTFIFVQTSAPVVLITENNTGGIEYPLNKVFFIMSSISRVQIINKQTDKGISLKVTYS